MAVFLVTPLSDNFVEVSEAVIAQVPESDRYELQAAMGWLVSFKGTSVDLSHKLGITSTDPDFTPTLGSAMVTLVTSYYGRGSSVMWEWLKYQLERG